jgi:hypothetical protein
MRAKNVLMGAVLAIAIGAPIVRFVGTSRWRNGPTANAPKSWAEKAYPNLIHYSSYPKGTHFATALFVSDARATFRSLRAA